MAILTSPRIIGQVSGDLTGSVFSPQVISVANITTGTLGVAHGGTGLTTVGASGSVLTSNGTSLVYTTVVGGGGVSAAEVSSSITGAINVLTSSLSASYVQTSALTAYALKSGTTFTGAVTASAGVSASVFVLSDGFQLSSSVQLVSLSGNYVLTDSSASLLSLAASTGSFTTLTASSGVNFNTPDGTFIRASNGHARIYAASNAFITGSNNVLVYAGTDVNLKAEDNINLSSSNSTVLTAPQVEITGALKISGILYGDGSGLTNVAGGISAAQATAAYDRLRFVTASAFDGNGVAEINLTSQATSGSTYFNTSSLTQVTVDVMVDTNGDGRYKYDLIAVELFESSSNLWVRVDAPAAATRSYRLIAINEASNKFTFGS